MVGAHVYALDTPERAVRYGSICWAVRTAEGLLLPSSFKWSLLQAAGGRPTMGVHNSFSLKQAPKGQEPPADHSPYRFPRTHRRHL